MVKTDGFTGASGHGGHLDSTADIDRARRRTSTGATASLPARMLNEFTYCPRLFHLMHVASRWADNVFTEDGKWIHRRPSSG